MKTPPNKKYFAYLRKSSEDKERQALSIPAQKAKIKERYPDLDIEFVEEERSAFVPYNRPLFTEMLTQIRAGTRTGLIAWNPDRVSRNEMDAAAVTYMLRTGELKSLLFPTYYFENTPEGIWMLQMALSQSQYESAKKGRDVKRGLEQKAKMGMYPNHAPLGYKNTTHLARGHKHLEIDEERWPLMRKMWDMLLTGGYSVQQIRTIANEQWKFRMPDTPKKKGAKIAYTTLYHVFSNPAYFGMFEYPEKSGNWHEGKHAKLITAEEYDRAQIILGKRGKPRPKKLVFDFTGMMHCGQCGAGITAEIKTKRQQNGKVHRYVYYHCTHKVDPNCKQGSIEEKELEKQIIKKIGSIEIPQEFHDYAMSWFKVQHQKDTAKRDAVVDTQQRAYKACLKKIDGLIDMRANGEIAPEAFTERYEPLMAEKRQLEEARTRTGLNIDEELKKNDEMLTFIERATTKFNNGSLDTRRRILATLGSNLTIKDKILNVDLEKTLLPMQSVAEAVGKIKEKLEPLDTVEKQVLFEQLCSQNTTLLGD